MRRDSFINESWKWLWRLQMSSTGQGDISDPHPRELLEKLETILPGFKGIHKVAPPHDATIHGERIPREPHRYSGRTAMQANINVSEPKPLDDGDSPLSFTMEGFRGLPPSSTVPFFWAPGWNSVQSVTKYQDEPGGSLRGGDPGFRLFKEAAGGEQLVFKEVPEAFIVRKEKWLLLPKYHVLGSGELSIYSKAIEELSPQPLVSLSPSDADQLGIRDGDTVKLYADRNEYLFPAEVKEELRDGVILVSAGLQGMPAMGWGGWGKIEKAE
jgi:NADH-quinone oxidoreductase subunit G